MFDKAKLLAKAFKIKRMIESEMTELEEGGIKIVVSGDQRVKQLSINGAENRMLLEVINKAMKKSQENAARKMKESGGLEGLF
jgi:DNA-binding protein YbaB